MNGAVVFHCCVSVSVCDCVYICLLVLLQRKRPLNPSSSAMWRQVADKSDEKAVCGCGN